MEGRTQGKSLIARLDGIDDRDSARLLKGREIAIFRDQLPDPGPGEYYWYDLIGLDVINVRGTDLGQVTEIRETGANDVLIVNGRQRCLIPLVMGEIIRDIDLENGRIVVDWVAE